MVTRRIAAAVVLAVGTAGCATTPPVSVEAACIILSPHMPVIASVKDTTETKKAVYGANEAFTTACPRTTYGTP